MENKTNRSHPQPQQPQNESSSLFHPTAEQKKKRRRFWRFLAGLWSWLWHFLLGTVLVCIITATFVVSVLVIFWVVNFDAEAYCPDLNATSGGNRSVIWVLDDSEQWVPYHNLEGGNSVWTDLRISP